MKDYAKFVGGLTLALGLTVLTSGSAHAQGMQPEIAGGWQYNHFSQSDCSGSDCGLNAPGGWFADVSGTLMPMWSWVGEVTGAYKTDNGAKLRFHTYSGGVRIRSERNPKVVPYGQILLGGINLSFSDCNGCDSANAFLLTLGGGVNIPVGPKWGARAGIDYRRGFFKSEDGGGVNAARFELGAYVKLGS